MIEKVLNEKIFCYSVLKNSRVICKNIMINGGLEKSMKPWHDLNVI